MSTNFQYINALRSIDIGGHKLQTRNAEVKSCIGIVAAFVSVPLVTVRKTAWKKALREMEWFLSGDAKCPDELKDWWSGQLNPMGRYDHGYGEQLRHYTSESGSFDQIEWLINSLIEHPNSRRLLTTTWHPEEMSRITSINQNPQNPTTCHGTMTQYFVRGNKLHMLTFQRSADMLLGVPHNWIQYWAFLMWLARRTGYDVGTMQWVFGDAHIYQDQSHLDCVKAILSSKYDEPSLKMEYNETSNRFKASDFKIVGEIPEPVTKIRPKLL